MQRYVLDFVDVATDVGAWVVARRSIVLARGAGLSAREGAQRYVRNWWDVLGILNPQRWHIEAAMRAIWIQASAGRVEPGEIWDSVYSIRDLAKRTPEPAISDLRRLPGIRVLPDPPPPGIRVLPRSTTLGEPAISDLRRSQKESTMRALRVLVSKGRLDTYGRAGAVSIAGMNDAYEAALASARPTLKRYVTRYGRPLPPFLQEQYEQELHDAFRTSAAIVRRAAARRR